MSKPKFPNPYPVSDPKWIFDEAEAFLLASQAILKGTQKERLTGGIDFSVILQYTSNVNHALAFELYLKCLIAIEQGQTWAGHNLFNLFERLSKESQDKIIHYHDDFTIYNHTLLNILHPNREVDFVSLLKESSNAFTNLRYLFQQPRTEIYDLDFAIRAVRYRIFDLKPGYKISSL